ncbi:hypothetical protein Trihar35433_10217 [Trichoderma harzianum]|nr:hypothetical protein Trihar35433_10217 [Trichoderma harzianum]
MEDFRLRHTHDDYTIGWVCALPNEQTAAILMLDDRHEDLPNPTGDHNTYMLGSIGKHNVVIAGLPLGRVGNNTAATVATRMVSSFPNIRVGLMVGVGGGIPHKTRLGDVVISCPNGTEPGVVQWDMGKTEAGQFVRTGSLAPPPTALLTALTRFKAHHITTRRNMLKYLKKLEKDPDVPESYKKSDSLQDLLFHPSYGHVEADESCLSDEDEDDCRRCDKSKLVRRSKRESGMIHCGLIASGTRVIKDANLRDSLSKQFNEILCIEMEAAGLMNDFPCVVIRGIADYSDSHKNEKWQDYAAATAAACAKALLMVVATSEVDKLQRAQLTISPTLTQSAMHYWPFWKNEKKDTADPRVTAFEDSNLEMAQLDDTGYHSKSGETIPEEEKSPKMAVNEASKRASSYDPAPTHQTLESWLQGATPSLGAMFRQGNIEAVMRDIRMGLGQLPVPREDENPYQNYTTGGYNKCGSDNGNVGAGNGSYVDLVSSKRNHSMPSPPPRPFPEESKSNTSEKDYKYGDRKHPLDSVSRVTAPSAFSSEYRVQRLPRTSRHTSPPTSKSELGSPDRHRSSLSTFQAELIVHDDKQDYGTKRPVNHFPSRLPRPGPNYQPKFGVSDREQNQTSNNDGKAPLLPKIPLRSTRYRFPFRTPSLAPKEQENIVSEQNHGQSSTALASSTLSKSTKRVEYRFDAVGDRVRQPGSRIPYNNNGDALPMPQNSSKSTKDRFQTPSPFQKEDENPVPEQNHVQRQNISNLPSIALSRDETPHKEPGNDSRVLDIENVKLGIFTPNESNVLRFESSIAERLFSFNTSMPTQNNATKIDDSCIDKVATAISQVAPPDLTLPPPTDSGYRSASVIESKFYMSVQHVSTTELTQTVAEEDMATEYSDESRTTSWKKPDYIWELADDLSKNVGSLIVDEVTRAKISDILPELLKVFALKIGYDGQTQMHRDIMAFVHKYRHEIGAAFMDNTFKQSQEDSHRSRSNVDEMSLEDRVGLWFKETSFEEPPEEFLRSTAENDEPIEEISAPEADLENGRIPECQLPPYKELFIGSNAYEWLLARLRRECLLVSTDPNTLEAIREKITTSLMSPRKISRRLSPQGCRATFELDWDILGFFNSQDYKQPPYEVFENVITITGSCLDAQAATCSQYMKQTWPLIGEVAIQLVKEVLKGSEGHSHQCKPSDEMTISAWIKGPKFIVEAHGVSASITEVGELFAWLGAALKASPRQNGLMHCIPIIRNIAQNTTSLEEIKPQVSSTHLTYQIEFSMEEVPEPFQTSNGQCWHDMFRNPAVVNGYPIPQRSQWNTGLEIPLNIMAALAQAQRLDRFNKKAYIKGFSTMLDESRISYLDDNVDQEQDIGQLALEGCRHVLGWCVEAKLYAGSPEAHYLVNHSMLPKPNVDSAFAGVSVSEGMMILNGPAYNIGLRETPVHLPRISRERYVRRLRWISTKFILLWDEHDKRGWLINGTSALLHIVRAFLSYAKDDNFKSAFCFKNADLQEAETPHTAVSAIDVLLNSHNRRLKLYKDEGKDNEYLLETQIDHYYSILEKLIDYQAYAAGHCGAKLCDRPRRYLEGWDFKDIATECPTIYPRVATIATAGKGWVDFIRTIQAVTLIGKGFGDIIRPGVSNECSRWAEVPTKQYYIASCVSDLGRLLKEVGNHDDGRVRLCDNLICHAPTATDMPRQGRDTSRQKHYEPVHILVPLSMSGNLPSQPYPILSRVSEAVIFGYNSHFPLIWGDTGPPQQNKLMELESPFKANWEDVDSAIGSNIMGSEPKRNFFSRSNSEKTEHSAVPSSELNSQTTKEAIPNIVVSIDRKAYARNHYTVGIICPLAKELKAVRTLFDNTHESLSTIPGDTNHYVLGDMAGHWVVATCLPAGEYGTNSAASVASNLKCSFSQIRFCLLVGIGGGVPSGKKDVRLGDVVVGLPTSTSPGVLQYDLGKEEDCNHFRLMGSLQRPPRALTTAISALQSNPEPLAGQLDESLCKITDRLPDYKHPGQDLDVLWQAPLCSHMRQRDSRTTAIPKIHYGIIASGNRVVKNVTFRDQLAHDHDILCFEMEAAGVINTVDCLVIRGICDYCDAQKNDMWQEYAAATAAAYAKLLLGFVTKVEDHGPGSSTEWNRDTPLAKKRKFEEME